jgi:hypothetical protein
MQYETCRHIKEDGTYCGSPSLQSRKYCYYHLTYRGRRLRRARALRDQVPYRLDIPPLEDIGSAQVALSEIVHALGAGQLDHRTAGKMLYAIQQSASLMKYRAKLEATQSLGGPQLPSVGNCGDQLNAQTGDLARVHAYPGFEQEFAINPGGDVDAETDWTLRKADEEAELRQPHDLPTPPAGLRPSSAQYKVYREEAYQSLNMQLNSMRHQLRDYYEEKRKQAEKIRQEAMSATPPERLANSA